MKAKSLSNKSVTSSEKDKKGESKKTTTKSTGTAKKTGSVKSEVKATESKKATVKSAASTTAKSSVRAKESAKPAAKTTAGKSAAKAEAKTTAKTTAKSTSAGKGKEKKVDLSSSKIRWKGSEPAGSHTGTIGLKEGKLHVKDNKITGGRVVIDMNSIVCEETNEELGRNLKTHLEGADFFDIEKYPYSEFEIISVTPKKDYTEITGNLTLKNVTKSVTFPAQINYTEQKVKCYSSNFLIDRTDWGIHYGSSNFFRHLADSFIDDHIEIGLLVETE